MNDDASGAPETVGAVLADAVETLYQLRLERGAAFANSDDKLAPAYLERDRFKQRFLRALLGRLDASR